MRKLFSLLAVCSASLTEFVFKQSEEKVKTGLLLPGFRLAAAFLISSGVTLSTSLKCLQLIFFSISSTITLTSSPSLTQL
jgi:hypothetical protein